MKHSRLNTLKSQTLILGTILTLTAGSMVGCVSQTKYDDANTTARTASDRHQQLLGELDDAKANISSLKNQNQLLNDTLTQARKAYESQTSKLSQANQSLKQFQDRLSNLNLTELDPSLERAFEDLASRYPNLVAYDATQGVLRISSDLTYASGSANVSDNAKPTLKALAQILSSEAALEHDINIVGHTDSQKLGPATRQKHGSNRGLSCHRAISVGDVLAGFGVDRNRILTSGWGEFRPLVPNTGKGNTPENRRVEIFLVPSTLDQSSQNDAVMPGPGTMTPDNEKPPARQIEPTK